MSKLLLVLALGLSMAACSDDDDPAVDAGPDAADTDADAGDAGPDATTSRLDRPGLPRPPEDGRLPADLFPPR